MRSWSVFRRSTAEQLRTTTEDAVGKVEQENEKTIITSKVSCGRLVWVCQLSLRSALPWGYRRRHSRDLERSHDGVDQPFDGFGAVAR